MNRTYNSLPADGAPTQHSFTSFHLLGTFFLEPDLRRFGTFTASRGVGAIEVNKKTCGENITKQVTMLLQNRAVFAIGLRMGSTRVMNGPLMDTARPSSDMSDFRKDFSQATRIAIITGAGVSAESGVPTFRGENEKWRKWMSQDLATPEAFSRTPSRVWEFFHYRRELVLSKKPSAVHLAIAECEARLRKQGRSVVVITQCIDDLHQQAGSKHVLRIHGSLLETRCMTCRHVTLNKRSPICPALKDKGSPDPDVADAQIPVDKLPRCKESKCHGLLRPNVVFFGETLDSHILTKVEKEMEICDLCMVVGTSSIVYPAAMFGPRIASRGVPVAEFNLSSTPKTEYFKYHFQGPCGTTLLPALAPHESEINN
uniref:NAD-dependent protein deacylase sirtuin-5, mitochondrial n=1 Tax=Monopterus albus TaxID=43700 RepID=A0A3Q3KHV4_MONAL|nr:NAD-dependent protein deacylase sirtuin-5, mitochondrial-like isoform X2 [Monopterus albus]